MFLVYSGVFRSTVNPLDVTKYYFECMMNKEGFLTYSICKSDKRKIESAPSGPYPETDLTAQAL